MTDWNNLKKQNNELMETVSNELYCVQYDLDMVANESKRLSQISHYSSQLIDKMNDDFAKATKLTGVDVTFLLVATALQCIRQYVIGTITQRTDDKTAADNTKGHNEEHSNRKHKYYNPSLDEIITNPVPFDAIYGSNGALSGGGKMGHRVTAIGHDPLLGLVFGTSNIATSTLTNNRFLSYHITTHVTSKGAKRDYFKNKAKTTLVLNYTKDKLLNEGKEGKKKFGASLMKEIIHLKSDMYSTNGIPLPIISIINGELASELASYGLDMGNVIKVAKQAEYAIFINALIGMLHGLFYDESTEYSRKMYSVRTRKILSYSNLIATASNVIAVAIAAGVGAATGNEELVKKSTNYLDIGGIMVTVYRIVTDRNFIYEVKKEFLEQEWDQLVIEL